MNQPHIPLWKKVWYLPRRSGQLLIVLYQRTLSPDHGVFAKFYRHGVCRFHPTCSQYGHEAVGRFGLIKGSWLTFWRILRCNPWSKGGEDPVPPISA